MNGIKLQLNLEIDGSSLSPLLVALQNAIEEAVRRGLKPSHSSYNERSSSDVAKGLERNRSNQSGKGQTSNSTTEEPLLVDSRVAAKMLAVSPRKLWAMQKSGEIPGLVHFGRLVRWNLRELQEWLNDGCPPVKK